MSSLCATQARDQLHEADALLAQHFTGVATLAPNRERPTPLTRLATLAKQRWLGREMASPQLEACQVVLAKGLSDIVAAQLAAFPGNLFWDQDALVGGLVRGAHGAKDPPEQLATTVAALVRVYSLFGRDEAIRFRYIHDFQYGFDWAKWVQKSPLDRSAEDPFSGEFLHAMEARGWQLLAQIGDDDSQYPPVPVTEVRNPFPFCREPDAERTLLQALSKDDWLPLCAWNFDAQGVWNRPFQAHRRERAEALGLLRGP